MNWRRCVFRVSVAVLWLVVAAVAAEVFLKLRAEYVIKHNRYILATPFEGFCPDLDDHGNPLPSKDGVIERQPPPTPPGSSLFVESFLALGEADRVQCAKTRDVLIGVYRSDGALESIYGDPGRIPGLDEWLPAPVPEHKKPAQVALDALAHWKASGASDCIALDIAQPGRQARIEACGYPGPDSTVVTFQDVTGGFTLTELQNRMNPGMAARWLISFFEYKRNVDLGPRWRSNNFGFRDKDVVIPKPPGVFRVCCVGGSTTEEGRLTDLCYPRLAEEILNAEFKGHPVIEVINCGVVGMDSTGERRRVFEFLALQPDLVVEYNAVNDLCHSMIPNYRDNAAPFIKLVRNARLVRAVLPNLSMPAEGVLEKNLLETPIANLRVMRDVFASHGVQFAVCSFAAPDWASLRREEKDYFQWDFARNWQGYYFAFPGYCHMVDIYNRLVGDFCRDTGTVYISVGEGLRGGSVFFGDICHLRPRGIEKKAGIVAEQIKPIIAAWYGAAREKTP